MSTPYRSLNNDGTPRTPVMTAQNGHVEPSDPNEYVSDSDSDSDPENELPESYIRQTPWQAITKGYGLGNWIFSILVNWGLNIGFGYWLIPHSSDAVVGAYHSPSSHDGARSIYSTAMAVDLTLASFLITFFSAWLATPAIVKAVKNGQAIPLDGESLQGGIYRFYPLRVHGVISRAFLFALVQLFTFNALTQIFVLAACEGGGFTNTGSECEMNAVSYIWFKGFWCAGQAFVAYPFILFAALNRDTLEPAAYDFFIQHQLLKLEDAQGGPPSPVVKQYAVRQFGGTKPVSAHAAASAVPTVSLN